MGSVTSRKSEGPSTVGGKSGYYGWEVRILHVSRVISQDTTCIMGGKSGYYLYHGGKSGYYMYHGWYVRILMYHGWYVRILHVSWVICQDTTCITGGTTCIMGSKSGYHGW